MSTTNEPTAGDLLLAERIATFRRYEDAAILIREHVHAELAQAREHVRVLREAAEEAWLRSCDEGLVPNAPSLPTHIRAGLKLALDMTDPKPTFVT